MKKLFVKTLAVLIVLLLGNAYAAASNSNTIVIFDSIRKDYSGEFIDQLKSNVWESDIVILNSIQELKGYSDESSVFLAIGPPALSAVLDAKTQIPIISLFTTRTSYEEIRKSHVSESYVPNLTAVYADADLNDQVSLITGLYNRTIKVGVLLSGKTQIYKSELSEVAQTNHVDMAYENITGKEDIFSAINKFKSTQIDAILAIPDSNIYNKSTLSTIILSSQRNRQSVIGFSENLVKSGALASVFYLPKHIATETSIILNDFFQNGYLGQERYARNFNVAVNSALARSLGLYKHSPYELETRVKKNAAFRDKAFEFVYVGSTDHGGV